MVCPCRPQIGPTSPPTCLPAHLVLLPSGGFLCTISAVQYRTVVVQNSQVQNTALHDRTVQHTTVQGADRTIRSGAVLSRQEAKLTIERPTIAFLPHCPSTLCCNQALFGGGGEMRGRIFDMSFEGPYSGLLSLCISATWGYFVNPHSNIHPLPQWIPPGFKPFHIEFPHKKPFCASFFSPKLLESCTRFT